MTFTRGDVLRFASHLPLAVISRTFGAALRLEGSAQYDPRYYEQDDENGTGHKTAPDEAVDHVFGFQI
jgi:hypothetical protein